MNFFILSQILLGMKFIKKTIRKLCEFNIIISKSILISLKMYDSLREMDRLFKTKDEIFIEEETHVGSRRVLIEKKNNISLQKAAR